GLRRDLTHSRARLGHGRHRVLLELGGALDGLDQVRHQIGAPLVGVLDLRPLAIDGLAHPDELVVAPDAGEAEEGHDRDPDETNLSHDGENIRTRARRTTPKGRRVLENVPRRLSWSASSAR